MILALRNEQMQSFGDPARNVAVRAMRGVLALPQLGKRARINPIWRKKGWKLAPQKYIGINTLPENVCIHEVPKFLGL
jgi:hypothetical protein